jgi:hypothetical protein
MRQAGSVTRAFQARDLWTGDDSAMGSMMDPPEEEKGSTHTNAA